MRKTAYLNRILLTLVLCTAQVAMAAEGFKTLAKPKNLKAFNLQDQHGKPFGVERLKGQWSMMFTGFTSCPDICPFTLRNLEAVRADLGLRLRPESIPAIVFIAVDPARDKPVLKEYLAYFHPSYVGITGDDEQLQALMSGLGGQYRIKRKGSGDKDYDVLHSAQVFIVNPEGQLVATLNPPFKAHATAEFLANLIRGRASD